MTGSVDHTVSFYPWDIWVQVSGKPRACPSTGVPSTRKTEDLAIASCLHLLGGGGGVLGVLCNLGYCEQTAWICLAPVGDIEDV